jgi:hypothetical protein
MAINLFTDKGTALDKQRFTWMELVNKPISKLDDDAFTRVRVILMNGVELDALRIKQVLLRMNREARVPLAQMLRVEQHQATAINWLLSADHSPLETTIAYEQVAIEVTASVAQLEPDPYLAQGYRYGLLEDFDHLYRYTALLDRLEGKDANNITRATPTSCRAGRRWCTTARPRTTCSSPTRATPRWPPSCTPSRWWAASTRRTTTT